MSDEERLARRHGHAARLRVWASAADEGRPLYAEGSSVTFVHNSLHLDGVERVRVVPADGARPQLALVDGGHLDVEALVGSVGPVVTIAPVHGLTVVNVRGLPAHEAETLSLGACVDVRVSPHDQSVSVFIAPAVHAPADDAFVLAVFDQAMWTWRRPGKGQCALVIDPAVTNVTNAPQDEERLARRQAGEPRKPKKGTRNPSPKDKERRAPMPAGAAWAYHAMGDCDGPGRCPACGPR